MNVDRNVLIDRPAEARAARADLEARALENRVFFTQKQLTVLVALALDPPSEFDLDTEEVLS